MASITDVDISGSVASGYLDIDINYKFSYTNFDDVFDWYASYFNSDGFEDSNSSSDIAGVGLAFLSITLDTNPGHFVGTLNLDGFGMDDSISESFTVFDAALERTSQNIAGTDSADIFLGGFGKDTFRAGAGNDVLYGGGNVDTLFGEKGSDIYYVTAGDKISESISDPGTDVVKASTTYLLAARQSIERLETINEFAKTAIKLYGNERSQSIFGNAGKNYIDGQAGNDVIAGGLDTDILVGGAGKDYFLFDTKLSVSNIDKVKDFKPVDDSFRLDDEIFGAFTRTGKIKSDEFSLISSKSEIVDSSAHILYDKAHGALYYDSNGGAASGRIQIATVENHAALTAADFLIV